LGTSTIKILLVIRQRSEAVGAQFIAPCGAVGHTPESVHRIRQQYPDRRNPHARCKWHLDAGASLEYAMCV